MFLLNAYKITEQWSEFKGKNKVFIGYDLALETKVSY